jgi:PAS domain S-box-containing protein
MNKQDIQPGSFLSAKQYLELTQTFMVALDSEGCIVMMNRAGRELLGYTEDEIIGCNWFQTCLSQPEGMQSVFPVFRSIMAGELAPFEHFENYVVCRDGTLHLIRWHNANVRDQNGTIIGTLSSGEDITERKLLEARLLENEERFRETNRIAHVGGWEIDNIGNTLAWTEETFQIYELSQDQAPTVADSIHFYHPEDQPKVTTAVQLSLESGANFDFEARLITAKKNLRWVRAIGKPLFHDGQIVGMRGMVQDITDRKHAEETLRLSESRFRNAFEHSAIGMALVSPQGKWLKVNKRVCDLLGYTEEELLGKTFQDITHPDDLNTDLEFVMKMLAGELKTYEMEKRYFHKDGQTIWVLLAVSLVWDEKGAPLHFISQIVDITERKRLEHELKETQDRMQFAMESGSIGIWDLDLGDHSVIRSLKHDQIFGYKELLPTWTYEMFLDHVLPEDRIMVEQKFQLSCQEPGSLSFECRILRGDGLQHWIRAVGQLRNHTKGKPLRMVGIVQDITERKTADLELLRLLAELEHKNEALNRFSYMVSHDLKGPLLTIMMFAEEITEGLSHNDLEKVLKSTQQIQKGSSRMSEMIECLLKYARLGQGSMDLEPVPLSRVLDDVRTSLKGSLSIHDMTINISENLPTIFGYPILLHELFQNLIENAIKFRNPLPPSIIDVGNEETASHWNIFVKDNGIGVAAENQSGLFNLFHKLNPKSEGSGIGLALVQRIVELHKGSIKMESAGIGQGCTFWISVPKDMPAG